MLQLSNIWHLYPESSWKLSIASLAVPSGHVLGIIGPNGSGKTTLLRIAAGILKPNKGTVQINGENISQIKRRIIARTIGYLPQYLTNEYDYTVEELAYMGRYPHLHGWGTMGSHDLTIIQESLEITGMDSLRDRRLSHLSGGERKRAFLASVLAQKPKILLLDEPSSALDIHSGIRFFRLLQKLSSEGIGIAVVTHDLNLASLFSDSILLLHNGKCLSQGQPNKILTNEIIQRVYGSDILIGKHPENDRPTFIPRVRPENKP
jgi:iron complex transport system ATP-binding protein